ncbi:uncharacterized protein [Ptychodera flava]|uniref:uncharacterized protein n=1 Tax=Ptychodera flava TaxID=63121 RepID=UPI00396A41DF
MQSLRCEDCKEISQSVSCCQGDLMLCPGCNKKRFGCSDRSSTISKNAAKDGHCQAMSTSGPVINELLCFIVNKIDVLTTDVLVKLCCEQFNDEEVEFAKKILFDLCATDQSRFIKRQGQNKRTNNVLDIIRMVHECESAELPCFVAKDLCRLPAVDITHVDISVILKELKSLRWEITQLKESHTPSQSDHGLVEDLQNLRQEVNNLKICMKSQINSDENTEVVSHSPSVIEVCAESTGVNITRKPVAAPGDTVDRNSAVRVQDNVSSSSYADIVGSIIPDNVAGSAPVRGSDKRMQSVSSSDHTGSNAAGFTTVTRRRKRHPVPSIGTANAGENCAIKVVNTNQTFKVFVTRLAPSTTAQDVQRFVKSSLQMNVKCEKLKTKYDTYASFLVETTRTLAE